MYSNTKLLDAAKKYGTSVLIEMLTENVIEEAAKKNGTKKPVSVIKRLLTNNEERFKKVNFINGVYYCNDPYRIFASSENFGFECATLEETWKPVANILKTAAENATADFITLDRSEIELYIKLSGYTRKKAIKKPYFCKSEKGVIIALNPFYLLDLIDFTGCEKAFISKKSAPIYAENENGYKAILLPCYHNETDASFQAWRENIFGRETKTA